VLDIVKKFNMYNKYIISIFVKDVYNLCYVLLRLQKTNKKPN